MKNLIIFISCFSLCSSITSCNSKSDRHESDSSYGVDTVDSMSMSEDQSNDETEEHVYYATRIHEMPETIEVLPDENTNLDKFTSKDRQTYNLRGDVKKCTFKSEVGRGDDVIEFKKNGNIILADFLKVKRNGNGYIKSIEELDKDNEYGPQIVEGESFIYDKDGRVKMTGRYAQDSGWGEYPYKYMGFNPLEVYVLAEVDYYTGEYEESFIVRGYTYEYTSFDEHGNWTERSVTEEAFEGKPEKRKYKEKRIIEYY